jgi:predicted nucleic acid-binding protein
MAEPPVLLDSSFLIALERETAIRQRGPARHFLPRLIGRILVVSAVSVEEVLEGSRNHERTTEYLRRFVLQPVHFAHARRCAVLQQRAGERMGENDAWLVATADWLGADVVGRDRAAFERLGARYLKFA